MIRIVALLGNPGPEYRRTRHNAAWLMAETADIAGGSGWQEKFSSRYAASAGVLFVKPGTYMNLSGNCVRGFLRFFKIPAAELLVVHDELELPFGTVGFRFGGGLGGHNGLRSLKSSLGTADFHRFRIGIGRPAVGDVTSHVLGRFSPDEESALPAYLSAAADIFLTCLRDPSGCAKSTNKVRIL